MRHKHCLTWNMVRNTEKRGKWEMLTVGHGAWGQIGKSWKMRNTQCRTWNMVRNTQKSGK